MGQVADRPATYADIEALPPNVVGEILCGRLVTHPRPRPAHVFASSSLGDELVGLFQKGRNGPGGWFILDEPELNLAGHVIVPNIAGWQKSRLPVLPETAAFNIAPDWVCEFLSPSTQRHDKGAKRNLYAEIGVRHLWHVDPIARTLDIYRLSDGDWIVSASYFEDDPVSAPPFDATTFSLGDLWHTADRPEPPSATN